jgi:hypothetical protein
MRVSTILTAFKKFVCQLAQTTITIKEKTNLGKTLTVGWNVKPIVPPQPKLFGFFI